MELSFRRLTPDELDEILSRDRERANGIAEKHLPAEIKQLIANHRSSPGMMRGRPTGSDLPADIRDASLSGDPAGWSVRKYAERQLDDEGKIAFLDFRKLQVHANGREVVVRDGLGSSILYSTSFSNGQGGFNL